MVDTAHTTTGQLMTPDSSSPNQPTFATATHLGDLTRFQLLRESIRRFAPNSAHVALVNHEELQQFQSHFASEPGLSFVSSRELLPSKIERERVRVLRWRGSVAHRLAGRVACVPWGFRGWHLQQLLKLRFAQQSSHQAVVFMDSDLVICRKAAPTDYFIGDQLAMLETEAISVEDLGFEVSTRVLLGAPRNEPLVARAYIHQAPRFLTRTARTLIRALEQANLTTPWEHRFIHQQWPSEYHLLGYAARHLEHMEGYCLAPGSPADWIYEVRFPEQTLAVEAVCAQCVAERGSRGFLLIQSNLKLPDAQIVPMVRRLLEQLSTIDKA